MTRACFGSREHQLDLFASELVNKVWHVIYDPAKVGAFPTDTRALSVAFEVGMERDVTQEFPLFGLRKT